VKRLLKDVRLDSVLWYVALNNGKAIGKQQQRIPVLISVTLDIYQSERNRDRDSEVEIK
jgi:hypothetical protein